jgi:hypothetical protein
MPTGHPDIGTCRYEDMPFAEVLAILFEHPGTGWRR